MILINNINKFYCVVEPESLNLYLLVNFILNITNPLTYYIKLKYNVNYKFKYIICYNKLEYIIYINIKLYLTYFF